MKQFLKSVDIWRRYRQEVTNRSLILCKSILLQYLFFCVAVDAYSHTVRILVWLLCIIFAQWTVLSGWVLHDSLLHSGLVHGNFLNTDVLQGSVATCLRCGGRVEEDFVVNLLLNLTVTEFRKSVNIWRSYGQDYSGLFFDSRCMSCFRKHYCDTILHDSQWRSQTKI